MKSLFSKRVYPTIAQLYERILSRRSRDLAGQVAWVGVPFAGIQIIRLFSNIALAWLLAPELLGAMILINTLRTGVELLTDIGIGQNIVSHPRGSSPDFYNTAWSLQIIRGFILFFITIFLSGTVSQLYNNDDLLTILPAVAPIFVISGFITPGRFLLQRNMNVRLISMLDLGLSTFAAIAQIILAWFIPTIWALIIGLYIGATASTLASFFIIEFRSLKFQLDRSSVSPIFKFGKWVFFSSLIFYLSSSWDRLYLADYLTVASFGVYGIAKTYSETLTGFFARVSQFIVFPIVSASRLSQQDLRGRISSYRIIILGLTASALAFFTAFANEFILLVYDARYKEAGIILTFLLFGTWFSILIALGDAALLGSRKPAGTAFANSAKLVILVFVLPIALPSFGLVGALCVFIMAEFFRYVILTVASKGIGLGFCIQDAFLTLWFFIQVVMLREISALFIPTAGIEGWVRQLESMV